MYIDSVSVHETSGGGSGPYPLTHRSDRGDVVSRRGAAWSLGRT
jgi:hypothetical protein